MKLIQFSDLHLKEAKDLTGGIDRREQFIKALDHAVMRHQDADRIVLTGDLSDEPSGYHFLREALDGCGLEYRLILGNHDDRAGFFDAFPDAPRVNDRFVMQSEQIGQQALIYVDTMVDGEIHGSLDGGRLEWLDHVLASAKQNGAHDAVIFMHHNPASVGFPLYEKYGLDDVAAFHAVLSRHKGFIRQIAFGHTHMPISGAVLGIPMNGCRATSLNTFADFAAPLASPMINMNPFYNVILLDGANTVIHPIDFLNDPGKSVAASA